MSPTQKSKRCGGRSLGEDGSAIVSDPAEERVDAMKLPKPHLHMLGTIIAIRTSLGDGLNDDEVTRWLRGTFLLSEAGFNFLCLAEGLVTLAVPEQDLSCWYLERGGLAPEKQKVARSLAEQYGFTLYEPPNTRRSVYQPDASPAAVHRHFEFTVQTQTAVLAHPQYLKVRLFGDSAQRRHAWESQVPLALWPDFLRDFSALYEHPEQ